MYFKFLLAFGMRIIFTGRTVGLKKRTTLRVIYLVGTRENTIQIRVIINKFVCPSTAILLLSAVLVEYV